MNQTALQFLNDIEQAVSRWNCDINSYTENYCGKQYFSVDVVFNLEDLAYCDDEISRALHNVAANWHAGIDINGTKYLLALGLDE